jgi:hypothetical protein
MKALTPLLFLFLSGCSDPLDGICAEHTLRAEEAARESIINCLNSLPSAHASIGDALEICSN